MRNPHSFYTRCDIREKDECMITADQARVLKWFNLKAEEVINSPYQRESSERRLGLTYTWMGEEEGMQISRVGHNLEALRSALMTIRIFALENDTISVKKMKELYDAMPIDKAYKDTFNDAKQVLDMFLDHDAVTLLDDKPTRRRLYSIFVYGFLAHMNEDKTPVYEKWKSDEFSFEMAQNELELIIHEYINFVKVIKKVNELVLSRYAPK